MDAGGAAAGLAAAVVACCVAAFAAPGLLASTVAFVPANTLTVHFYPWALVTAAVVEPHPAAAAAVAAAAATAGGGCERVWGAAELLKFAAVVAAATHLSVFVYAIVCYASGQQGVLYQYFPGGLGLAQALLVAAAQLRGDEPVVAALPVRWRGLPVAVCALAVCWEVASPTHVPTDAEIGEGRELHRGTHMFHAALSPWYAWAYLRFFQRCSPAAAPGDASESFAFHSLFPHPARPVVAAAGRVVGAAASRLGFPSAAARGSGGDAACDSVLVLGGAAPPSSWKPPTSAAHADMTPPQGLSAKSALTAMGTNATDADRRRQVALAALKERMEKVRGAAQAPPARPDPGLTQPV